MHKTILAFSAAALALGGAGAALADHHGAKRGPMAADMDGNGELTLAELRAHGAQRFARMDANGDGQIDATDRQARHADRFARIDADGNGELSAAEMQAAHQARMAKRAEHRAERQAKRFDRMDTDKSGGVSQAELEAAHAARQEARAENREGRKGMRGMRGKRAMHARHMLGMADANGDRIVTRTEFDASIDAHFAKIDTDGSGTITAEERKAAHAQMMQRMKMHRGMHHGDKPEG